MFLLLPVVGQGTRVLLLLLLLLLVTSTISLNGPGSQAQELLLSGISAPQREAQAAAVSALRQEVNQWV